MKQKNKSLTQSMVIINKHGQVYLKRSFYLKFIKKFYRFIVLDLF